MARKSPSAYVVRTALNAIRVRNGVGMNLKRLTTVAAVFGTLGSAVAALSGCSDGGSTYENAGAGTGSPGVHDDVGETEEFRRVGGADLPGSPGPDAGPEQFLAPVGTDRAEGQTVFRFETFGNEGFWTGVLELPQGMLSQRLTPAQAIATGLSFDSEAIPARIKLRFEAELATAGPTPDLNRLPAFRDPSIMEALLEADAVIGLPAGNVTALNGTLDIDSSDVFAKESIGVSCALCHSISDGSILHTATGGSIGLRMDGRTNHNLQFGQLVAMASRSRAFYPTLALDLIANNHGSVSRKGPQSATNPLIPAAPTEAEVDAYLDDPILYPVGMFDDAPDGDGAPMHTTPLFRADLAAPWGSEGSIHMLQNFSNLVYTALLDPTDLIGATPPPSAPSLDGGPPLTGAQVFEYDRGGPAGLELIANYKNIIENDLGIMPYSATNPNGYPFVGRSSNPKVATGLAAGAKVEPSPLGIQVDQTELLDMNAYLFSLRAPPGKLGDPVAIVAGRIIFREQCTTCHNDDQSKFVPENIVPFSANVDLFTNAPSRPDLWSVWDAPVLADRPGPPFAGLVPVRNQPGIFDDKMVIIEASNQSQPRGDALPLLLDLARKPVFLHDNEVTGPTPEAALTSLLDPARGATAPHAFYISNPVRRAAVVAFLQRLDDNPLP